MGHAEITLRDQPAQKPISLDEFWIPFTPNREFKADPRIVVRAEGMYYWNDRGERIIDASSGLFCVAAGHGRKEIAEAVHRQLSELDFVAPFLRAHPKSFELASRVAELTPGDLNRIFFVNSGSEAVDTAMKVALAYHQARGQSGRTMFVSRERAYHGVNFGGVALSGIANQFATRNIILANRLDPGIPPIKADANQLQQHHVGCEALLEFGGGHGMAAVLDYEGLASKAPNERQRLDQHLGPANQIAHRISPYEADRLGDAWSTGISA